MPIGHLTQLLTYSDIRDAVNMHVIIVTDVPIHRKISYFSTSAQETHSFPSARDAHVSKWLIYSKMYFY
jgi:hypothetical protein